MPRYPSPREIAAALAQPALRAPLAFAALAAAMALTALAGPVTGLAVGLVALHEASGQPLQPLVGALAVGLLAGFAWLVL